MAGRTRQFCSYTECLGPLFPPCCCNVLAIARLEPACRACEPWMESIRERHKYRPIEEGSPYLIRIGMSEENRELILNAYAKKIAP